MTGDLFLPVMFIVIMFIIIGCIEDGLTLLAIAFLFAPFSFSFAHTIENGGYTLLFGAPIVAGDVGNPMIAGSMFMVSIFAVGKLLYIRNVAKRSDNHDRN